MDGRSTQSHIKLYFPSAKIFESSQAWIILSGEKSKEIIEWCLCVERTNWSEFYVDIVNCFDRRHQATKSLDSYQLQDHPPLEDNFFCKFIATILPLSVLAPRLSSSPIEFPSLRYFELFVPREKNPRAFHRVVLDRKINYSYLNCVAELLDLAFYSFLCFNHDTLSHAWRTISYLHWNSN